jgi:magnesium transporter
VDSIPDFNTPVREIARPDAVRLLETETVGQALERLRTESIGERIVYFYVTDAGGKLVGVVPTRRFLVCNTETRVGDVMIQPVIAVCESEPYSKALEALTERRLLALPVVDAERRLIGVLDLSAFTQTMLDVERRETAEEIFQIVGVQIERERNKSDWHVLGNRFPWLLCNVASGMAAAVISEAFGAVLRTVVALAFFVPLVLTIAESIAMQTVTVSVQGMHVRAGAPGRWAFRETRIGMLLGVVSGIIVGLIAVAWLGMIALAAVVAATMAVAGAVGAALGYVVPRLVRRWNLDPRIASGPAVLALTDVAAVTFYLSLARAVLT